MSKCFKILQNMFLLKKQSTRWRRSKQASPPHATTERITTRPQNKEQQKIKLDGNPTTKDLKKSHSSRCAGEAETQRWEERPRSHPVAQKGMVAGCAAPHSLVVDKNQEGYLGSEQS